MIFIDVVLDGAISMKPEQFSNQAVSSRIYGSALLRQLCVLGGVGLWGVTLIATPAWAQTDTEVEVGSPAGSAPVAAPVETSAELLLRPQVTASPSVEPALPSPQPAPVSEAPVPIVPENPERPTAVSEDNSEFVNVFIDPTDYSLGATPSPDSPSVVFSERSTGCQFTLGHTASNLSRSCNSAVSGDTASLGDGGVTPGQSAEGTGLSVGPVAIDGRGVTVGSTTVISREYFNERLRPLNLLRRGAEEFVFPLAVPAPITSLFGWREHPIFHERRFHTGTDLGAPEGTPVLATKDGEVSVAQYLGGYGLTVILHHESGTQETRYAHLSRILVRPGESVKQGEVVGLVGSTGNSTGPHLHFELRELTAQGWMLINPDQLMDYTVASLVEVVNNPFKSLGLVSNENEPGKAGLSKQDQLGVPHRPSQPNAS